jgi:hypothetical protein
MRYQYINKKGETAELSFPIGQAPQKTKIGRVIFERDVMGENIDKQFCLKGSGWPSQDAKRKKQMTENNLNAGKRSKNRWGEPKKVVPNYKGKLTDSWREAASLAKKDKGR